MQFFEQNFLICPGVEKCGTTSLHALLTGQPGLTVPSKKELFFFNADFDKGEAFYAAHFEDGMHAAPASRHRQTASWHVDITPSYFRREKTLQRIRQSLSGKVRILVLIRNPIKRAFSFYWHDMVRHYLRGEKAANNFDAFLNCSFKSFFQLRNDYYFTPYAPMLKRWLAAFPDQCVVHVTEEVIADPKPLIRSVNALCDLTLAEDLAFPRENTAMLETLSIFPKGLRRHTADGTKVMPMRRQNAINAMAMQGTFTHFVPRADAEAMFKALFADDIRQCEDILGRDLSVLTEQSDLVSPIVKAYGRGER
ncbi:MAG: sulfotransferase domain-containing protein [Pseudomonadota bacterium]